MKRSSLFFAVLFLSFLPILADAQMGKKRKRDTGGGALNLEDAKIYKNKAVQVEFKVPKRWKVRDRKGKGHTKAEILSTAKVGLQAELMVFPAQKLEDAREMLIKQLTEQYPASTHRIFRGVKYGGMAAITIRFEGIGGSGDVGLIYSIADVPYHGLIALKFQFPKEKLKQIEKIHKWMMASFRMSGEEGENLLFQPRVVHYDTGLSYRVPLGVVEKKKPAVATNGAPPTGPIFEGQLPGGSYIKVERVEGDGDGELRDLMDDWAGGAKAIGKGTAVQPLTKESEALCLKFPKYSGRPPRAFAAFRPNAEHLFRIEVSGGDDPLQDAERMAATVDWRDIAKEEAEVEGWGADLNVALKQEKERTVRKIGRKLTKRYYLKNARALAHVLLKKGEEKAQIYAMETLGKGGSPLEDFRPIRSCMDKSKNKTRTKMRIKGCEALANMVDLKVTNFLMSKVRDKDTKVGKAAILALGKHTGNRKKIIPTFLSSWHRVLKEGEKKDPKKQLKRSRLADAYRTALSMLTGIEVKVVKDAKDWYAKNRKELVAEELIKLK